MFRETSQVCRGFVALLPGRPCSPSPCMRCRRRLVRWRECWPSSRRIAPMAPSSRRASTLFRSFARFQQGTGGARVRQRPPVCRRVATVREARQLSKPPQAPGPRGHRLDAVPSAGCPKSKAGIPQRLGNVTMPRGGGTKPFALQANRGPKRLGPRQTPCTRQVWHQRFDSRNGETNACVNT